MRSSERWQRSFGFFLLLTSMFFIPLRSWPEEEARAVWFSRFEYGDEQDIRSQIARADSCRCNIVLFQIRGQGDALYLSALEPWSELLGGSYPGFDPLAVAIEESHLRGLKLHAYVNAFPLWSGSEPPSDPQHPYNLHPEWIMVDEFGAPMDPASGYAFISPGIPQAAQHLRDVIWDIVANYDVDGLHLDYIRYPGAGYSYDDSSLARFQREYGGTPQTLPDQWKQFRRNLVTQLVGAISEDIAALKPWVKISAATWGNFYDGYTFYYQDSHGWMELGYLDFAAPMIYLDNIQTFRSRLANHLANAYGRHIYAGIGAYLLSPGDMLAQIDTARSLNAQGCSFFSSTSLETGTVELLRSGPFAQPAQVPAMPWQQPKPFALSVARATSGTEVDALFDRPVQPTTAQDESNYIFDNGLALAAGESARPDSAQPMLVHLTTTSQAEGMVYTLTVHGVEDTAGRTLDAIDASRKFVGRPHTGAQIVVDNSDPGFSTVGTWSSGAYGTPYGSDYRWASAGTGASATWTPDIPTAGVYDVSAYWVQGTNRAPDAPFIVRHANGLDTVRADQRQNGEQWNKLGSFFFQTGADGQVTLTNEASTGVVIADAIRLVEVFTVVPGAPAADRSSLPASFALEQNYPNPFNSSTRILFSISAREGSRPASMSIYNVLGQKVRCLLNEPAAVGTYALEWDGRDDAGGPLARGVCFCRLRVGEQQLVRKMLLLR